MIGQFLKCAEPQNMESVPTIVYYLPTKSAGVPASSRDMQLKMVAAQLDLVACLCLQRTRDAAMCFVGGSTVQEASAEKDALQPLLKTLATKHPVVVGSYVQEEDGKFDVVVEIKLL